MARKKIARDPQDEIDATCKLLCDEAANHMKVRNYTKALSVYRKVKNPIKLWENKNQIKTSVFRM